MTQAVQQTFRIGNVIKDGKVQYTKCIDSFIVESVYRDFHILGAKDDEWFSLYLSICEKPEYEKEYPKYMIEVYVHEEVREAYFMDSLLEVNTFLKELNPMLELLKTVK